MEERIERAREILKEIHHVPVATVNQDGTPHNSPVFMAFDDKLRGYWASRPDSLHSRNIARNSHVFMVIFDSKEGHGGLYIAAEAKALDDPKQAGKGHAILRRLKEQFYGSMGELDAYLGEATQRIYCAVPQKIWVNQSERDANGIITKDARYEIPLEILLPRL